MSLTAWTVFYLAELLLWWWLVSPSAQEEGERQDRKVKMIFWLGLSFFSTVVFVVGVLKPDVRHFSLRMQ
jgi:hypothetical protein